MSLVKESLSTANNGSTLSQLFWTGVTCVALWLVFVQDWTPLRQVRIQSPITFISEEQPILSAAGGLMSPIEGGMGVNAEVKKRDTIRTAAAFDLSAIAKAENITLRDDDLSSDAARQKYIKSYAFIAIEEMHKSGVPASITLAQALLESGAGKSGLATKNNNHFGMKCFSKRCKKGHCTNFSDDSHKDFFLKFPTIKASYRAHSALVTSGTYASLKKCDGDYRCWAQGLEDKGYATIKNAKGEKIYAEQLIRLIRLYGLNRLDRL